MTFEETCPGHFFEGSGCAGIRRRRGGDEDPVSSTNLHPLSDPAGLLSVVAYDSSGL